MKNKQAVILIVACTAIVVLLCGFFVSTTRLSKKAPEKTMGIWIWKSPETLSSEEMKDYVGLLHKEGFNTAYIDVSDYIDIYESKDQEKEKVFSAHLKEFTAFAHKQHISVEALAANELWSRSSHSYIPPIFLEYVTKFNNSVSKDEQLSGMQFDIESYNLPEFSDAAGQEEILNEYVALVQTLTLWIQKNNPSLKLGFAVPFWFDNQTRELPLISFNQKKEAVGYHVLDLLQTIHNGYIVIMDYRNTPTGANGSIQLARPQIDYATENTSNVKIVIGQETTNVDPSSITFFGKSKAALVQALDEIKSAYAYSESFNGFAIHDFVGYRALIGQ